MCSPLKVAWPGGKDDARRQGLEALRDRVLQLNVPQSLVASQRCRPPLLDLARGRSTATLRRSRFHALRYGLRQIVNREV